MARVQPLCTEGSQRKMRSSQIIAAAKRNRYNARKPSKLLRKKDCLNKLEKSTKFQEDYRLGKISSLKRR